MKALLELASYAVKSLIEEVSVSPKPGLVDRFNNGAHSDMDFFTFIDSSFSLHSYFFAVAEKGYYFQGDCYTELFASIRPLGMKAEKSMYTATNGVNCHKGIIFSLGILVCAAGLCLNNKMTTSTKHIIKFATQMLEGLCDNDFSGVTPQNARTAGERLYIQYGVTGIRQEAQAGFPTVINSTLPALYYALNNGAGFNDSCIYALLSTMSVLIDTNILSRKDFKTLEYVQKTSGDIIKKCNTSFQSLVSLSAEMDTIFISQNISPGGSADMLALAIFLYYTNSQSK